MKARFLSQSFSSNRVTEEKVMVIKSITSRLVFSWCFGFTRKNSGMLTKSHLEKPASSVKRMPGSMHVPCKTCQRLFLDVNEVSIVFS